jgi:hypothetical protein
VIDPDSASAREGFAGRVAAKASAQMAVVVDAGLIAQEIMQEAERRRDASRGEGGPEFVQYGPGDEGPGEGIYRLVRGELRQLTNFQARFIEDFQVLDEGGTTRKFRIETIQGGSTHAFELSAADFTDHRKLKAALVDSVGAGAQFPGPLAEVERAISATSDPRRRVVTTAHGWDEAGVRYLTTNGHVDREGFHAHADGTDARLDLGVEPFARGLGLRDPLGVDLPGLRRHVAEDLLALQHPRVMLALLGQAALAVLERFAGDTQRASLWLVGPSGVGKSLAAKLVANFFGDFALVGDQGFVSWVSTPNHIEKTGHFFKDALYLVDDYKPELILGQGPVRVLQAYADGAGRGRLRRDASAAPTYTIRGLLVVTGEDLYEQAPSALARTIVVEAPFHEKDAARARRCRDRRREYPALMADFIAWTLRTGVAASFADRVERFRGDYLEGVDDQANGMRVAGNLARLAAATEAFAEYLDQDGAWPGRAAALETFFRRELVAVRDRVLAGVAQQRASSVFLEQLGSLIATGEVSLLGHGHGRDGSGERRGRVVGRRLPDRVEIVMEQALGAVQESLRRQGRPPLAISKRALGKQLAEDGKLLDRHGRPVRPCLGGERGYQPRFYEDGNRLNVYAVPISEFINGPGPFVPDPEDRDERPGDEDGREVEGLAPETVSGPAGRVATPGPGGANRSPRQHRRPPV